MVYDPLNIGTTANDGTGDKPRPAAIKMNSMFYEYYHSVPILKTANYIVAAADAGQIIHMNLAGANTVTVPANATVAIAIGATIGIRQWGLGQTTIVAGDGTVLLRTPGTLLLRTRYSLVNLHKVDTNEWVVDGDTT